MGVLEGNKDKQKPEKPTKPDEDHVGEIPDLPVHTHGSSVPGEAYVKTTESIANYVGKEYGKAICERLND